MIMFHKFTYHQYNEAHATTGLNNALTEKKLPLYSNKYVGPPCIDKTV